MEVIHDELVDAAERAGLEAAPGHGWRIDVERLVQGAERSVRWDRYFRPDGRSACAGEIYAEASGG